MTDPGRSALGRTDEEDTVGRLVIITGAGSEEGIGQAVARRLLEAGDDVALVDRDADGARANAERFAHLPGTVAGFGCDVSSRASVVEAAAAVEREMGPAWGLVNAAAWGASAPAESVQEDEWRRGFDIIVGGSLWWAQAVFPQMKERGAGRIVNFGSEASDLPSRVANLNYVAAKGAIRSFTKGLAMEWGPYGITVNTVWPVAATAAMAKWAETNPEVAEAYLDQTALHRFGDAYEDIAPVVQFLLSDAAAFVSGSTVAANGGRAKP
jgi:NAD(P)-dependent dehydrogenase (short-subunit alcohol dehydrogenase family)